MFLRRWKAPAAFSVSDQQRKYKLPGVAPSRRRLQFFGVREMSDAIIAEVERLAAQAATHLR
jgi:hypothetical protein